MSSSNNKRIAKNTLVLYFRMLLIMGVSLYSVRIVLNSLGPSDYGIYSVVGGIIVMFSFLSSTMAAASQRFFSFALGRGDFDQLKKLFSLTMTIYVIIGIIIVVLAETIGLWFLNSKMNIPAGRIHAANWVYQFAILSFMMTMFTIPYNALIIAHEQMEAFAYISIIEAVLKLLIVLLLDFFHFDKLKLYALLVFCVTTIVTLLNRTYCRKRFSESKLSFYWDSGMFKEVIGYSGWNLMGTIAVLIRDQGTNILLNLFFGTLINAARGIAFQVNSVISQFSNNFLVSVNPQIVKYYAGGKREEMFSLVFRSSKFAFFLLFTLSLPVLLETKFILSVWLKSLPDQVVLFTRLIIINALIDSVSIPLITSALATGKIRRYQIIVGGIMLLNLPISLLLLKLGFPAYITICVAIFISVINLFSRLWMLKEMIQFPVIEYLKKVIIRILIIAFFAYFIIWTLQVRLPAGFGKLVIITIADILIITILVYFLGMSKIERHKVKQMVAGKLTQARLSKKNNNHNR